MKAKTLRLNILCMFFSLFIALTIQDVSHAEDNQIRIGVLAKRGATRCLEKWSPTAEYLTARIPGVAFTIVPLDFEEINAAVEKGEVDFVLTNPSIYVELEYRYGASRISTLKNLRLGVAHTRFAGVIFCKANRDDIRHMDDLKGKTFMAVDESSLGGWRMAWRELKENGIDPYHDFKELGFGGTQDAVVFAVRDGVVDAGTVRTDTLERMEMEGKINPQNFYVIQEQTCDHMDLPFIHSTRAYPEWPFATTAHVPDALAKKVTIALLEMPPDSPAAKAAECTGWTVPLNYHSVHECLRELKVGPYKDLGKITLASVVRQYWVSISLVFGLFLGMAALNAVALKVNRNIKKAHARLLQEVEARKSAEERTSSVLGFNEALISASPVGIFTYNDSGQCTSANEAGCRIIGASREQALALNFRQIESWKKSGLLEVAEKSFATGEPQHLDLNMVTTFGKHVWLDCKTVTFLSGGMQHLLLMVSDISKQKEMENDVREAMATAQTANQAKSDCLANMSHEIRTPMNAIIGMTEIALDTELTGEQREYLEIVKTSGDSLLGLINDILDFSKIQAKKLDLDPIDFNLPESLGDTLKTLALRAHRKGLEIAYYVLPDVPNMIIGDPGRLRQVLLNLVSNAIKFTDQGEVVVRVAKESETDDEIHLHFTVTDTGAGIPSEKQRLIFEPFSQADGSTTRQFGGTGLGLAISKYLVEKMEGRIWVESEVGKGSSFHFTACFGRPKTPSMRPVAAGPFDVKGLHVLVVDDNATNRHILVEILGNWHMKPQGANNGQAALAVMERVREQGESFALVLVDAVMPQMDGFALAEQVRKRPGVAGPVIMMLTSAGHRGDAARCRELGIAAYLTKPLKQSELLDAIMTVLAFQDQDEHGTPLITRHTLRESRASHTFESSRPLRILVAEDNAVNQKLVTHILEKWGHTVVPADNGRKAVAALEKETFDLVLMDIQMPEMDGLEATKEIRNREKSFVIRHSLLEKEKAGHEDEMTNDLTAATRIPIIALTAHAMKGDRDECIEAGMDDYVSKPIRPKELFEAIERQIATPAQARGADETTSNLN